MFDEAWVIWSQSGADAVVEYLKEQEDSLETAETYHKLLKELYWKEKNGPDMIVLARAGFDYSLSAAEPFADSDPGMAYELRSQAKSLAYDLASFTWRGWDEPGIELTAEDEATGLQAAESNLRLAFELDKGAVRLSRAYWILGAQQMAARRLVDAEESFLMGEQQALEGEAPGDDRLCHAFAILALGLQQPDDQALQAQLVQVKSELGEVEHGQMYVGQVETAEKVFGYLSGEIGRGFTG